MFFNYKKIMSDAISEHTELPSSPEDNRGSTDTMASGSSSSGTVHSVASRRYLPKMGRLSTFVRNAMLCVILRTSFVHCDITDGNTEHLKREHSLMKPYHGTLLNRFLISSHSSFIHTEKSRVPSHFTHTFYYIGRLRHL